MIIKSQIHFINYFSIQYFDTKNYFIFIYDFAIIFYRCSKLFAYMY